MNKLNLSEAILQLDCPKCDAKNPFTLAQVQHRERIVCVGCGTGMILLDNGSIQKAQNSINKSLDDLSKQIEEINRELKIKF